MTKKEKKFPKNRRAYSFVVNKVFPPSDLLGLEILRLMAGYNDMGRIVDWMKADRQTPKDPLAKEICLGRRSMQMRLMIGFLHEAYEAVERMQELADFPELAGLLDQRGQMALQELRKAKSAADRSIPKLLEYIRDKAAFHYIAPKFSETIKTFKKTFGEDFEAMFIYEGTTPEVRAYYVFADALRDGIAFGMNPSGEMRKALEEAINIQRNLYIFLESAHKAHVLLRGTQKEFRLES